MGKNAEIKSLVGTSVDTNMRAYLLAPDRKFDIIATVFNWKGSNGNENAVAFWKPEKLYEFLMTDPNACKWFFMNPNAGSVDSGHLDACGKWSEIEPWTLNHKRVTVGKSYKDFGSDNGTRFELDLAAWLNLNDPTYLEWHRDGASGHPDVIRADGLRIECKAYHARIAARSK